MLPGQLVLLLFTKPFDSQAELYITIMLFSLVILFLILFINDNSQEIIETKLIFYLIELFAIFSRAKHFYYPSIFLTNMLLEEQQRLFVQRLSILVYHL